MSHESLSSAQHSQAHVRWFGYLFGGFGTILFIASILCFIAWKPLGEPAPAVANLALAIVLLVVILVMAAFVRLFVGYAPLAYMIERMAGLFDRARDGVYHGHATI